MQKNFYLFIVLGLMASCMVKKPVVVPTKAVEQTSLKSANKQNTIAVDDGILALHNQYCGSCHAVKNYKDYTDNELKSIVPSMCKKVENKHGKVLSPAQQEAILNYILASN